MKALQGTDETITLIEAIELRDKMYDEFMGYLITLVENSVTNKDEKANAKLNMARKLGALTGACEFVGLLMEPEDYFKGVPGGDKVKIVEVDA